jgi:hypothetical protein
MKKLFLVSFLIINISAKSTVYYVDPSGNDNSGFGTKKFPWKSLYKACSIVQLRGDTIHLNAGTYIETKESNLAVGISVIGEGTSSVIISQIPGEWNYVLALRSDREGTNGNQNVENIRFEGGNSSWSVILINGRSNVKIHDCSFSDFKHSGVTFNGRASTYDPGEPSAYATGNQFYNNTITNCSEFVFNSYGAGALEIGGQDGMLIYNNIIVQNRRPNGYNGYCIKYYNDGYNRGLKIYNNTIIRESPTEYNWDWNFAIELWHSTGGIEIYSNTIYGSIDIVHGKKGGYNYTIDIHDNVIGYETLQKYSTSANNGGVFIEREVEGVYIRNNIFRNIGSPIQVYPTEYETVKDIYIQYNLFDGIGIAGGGNNEALINWATVDGQKNVSVINFNFINNTVFVRGGGAGTGVRLPNIGKATNVTIANNIIQGFLYHSIIADLNQGATISNLSVENNLLYSNGNNSPYFSGNQPSNQTIKNNITVDPKFWSETNFHLKPGSLAIKAGKAISGLVKDKEGVIIGNPPNIGCFETLASEAVPKYYKSVIENAAPDIINISYDLALDTVKPEISAFNIAVNGNLRRIDNIELYGSNVFLTLAKPVQSEDIVTLSYNVPFANALQSITGIKAESIDNQLVTNNVVLAKVKVIIFPNPVFDNCFVGFDGNSLTFPLKIKIVDITGKTIFSQNVYSNPSEIYLASVISPGNYILQAYTSNFIIGEQSLVIIR